VRLRRFLLLSGLLLSGRSSSRDLAGWRGVARGGRAALVTRATSPRGRRPRSGSSGRHST